MRKYLIAAALLSIGALACKQPAQVKAQTAAPQAPAPRNIILLIGDGMGISQITAGLYSNGNRLEMERFKVIGLHKSYAYDDLVTDSASGATAFSTGVKTYNAAIGVGPDTLPRPTILEMAQGMGMATGLVASSTIVHATPASFAAHVKHRNDYEDIALDMSDANVDFMVGGGKRFFDERRKDGQDLLARMAAVGYAVSDFFQAELGSLQPDPKGRFFYLSADNDPLPVAQGRDYLPLASRMALDFLDKKSGAQGFFLMIEGSQIDWGGHANNSDYIISEVLEFDGIIGEVLDWAERDGQTLVIVTADHETGGYAINKGSSLDTIVAGFTSDYHTADLIPVFAAGPGAEAFMGIYENTAIFDKMQALLRRRSPRNGE